MPWDRYLPVETNDSSVKPRFVGRRVDVRLTLDEVIVSGDGTEVARHGRCLASHQVILEAEHAQVLRAIRTEAAIAAAPVDTDVEQPDLAVCDRIIEAG